MLSAAAVTDHLFLSAAQQSSIVSGAVGQVAASQGSTTLPSSAYTPQQICQAYGINSITLGSLVGTGAGQTIAIVDAYDDPDLLDTSAANFASSDLHKFDAQFGLADPPSFVKLNQSGGTTLPGLDPAGPGTTSWEGEEALDVEWAHAVAPGASIDLVEATSGDFSDLMAAVNTARNLPGVSVVSMSFGWPEATLDSLNGTGSELATDATFTTPAGHQGVTFLAATGDNGAPGDYPAFSPNVLAVGGTSLVVYDGGYGSENAWGGAGSGASIHETEPGFQASVQGSRSRQIPDVSFSADPLRGMALYDSYDFGSAAPWTTVGGTSLSTACWAGLVAIANQLRASQKLSSLDGASQTLPGLYGLPSTDFYAIADYIPPPPPGYLEATGLGSPVANKLVPDLASVTHVAQATTIAVSASGSATYGGTVGLTATLSSGGAGVPNEAVVFSIGGTNVGTATTDASGIATLSSVSLFGVGVGNCYVATSFAGDATYAGTDAVTSVTIANAPAPTTVTLSPSFNSVANGQTLTLTATVATLAPSNAVPSGGTVTFYVDGTAQPNPTAPVNGVATLTGLSLSTGPHVVTASYSGDGVNFAASASAIGPSSLITTVAGSNKQGYSGDAGPATAAMLTHPESVAVDSAGDVFFADSGNDRVREVVKATGNVMTVAGDGSFGPGGDGGPATAASLTTPWGVAVDAAGDIFIADTGNNRVREVVKSTGNIITVAGNGIDGYSGDGGAATAASLDNPESVAADAAGDLFIADSYNNRIREVVKATGDIITVAGNGSFNGWSAPDGDDGPATAAFLGYPEGVTVDSAGNLFIADTQNNRIREVFKATGYIVTVAGNGGGGLSNGGYGTATATCLESPSSVAVDSAGNLFTANDWNLVYEIVKANGMMQPVAGASYRGGPLGDGGPASAANFADPQGVALDGAGNLIIADTDDNRVRQISVGAIVDVGQATTMTLSASSAAAYGGAIALTATLSSGGAGVPNVLVTFSVGGTSAGTATTNANGVATLAASVVGVNAGTYSGGLTASFAGNVTYATTSAAADLTVNAVPLTITADSASKPYGAPDPTFSVSYAGFVNGESSSVLGGAAVFTTNEPTTGYASPSTYTVTPAGLTSSNYAITFVSGSLTVTPARTTVAVSPTGISVAYGQPLSITATVAAAWPSVATPASGTLTFYIDGVAQPNPVPISGGSATLVESSLPLGPHDITASYSGDGFDFTAGSTQVLAPNSIITTAVGNGTPGYGGDGGAATAAALDSPAAVAVDAAGDLFIADTSNNRIREVIKATGNIITVAGNGSGGYSGDGGPATATSLYHPTGVAVDSAGDLFIADNGNSRVREVVKATGDIITVAGTGNYWNTGNGGPATAASIASPTSLALDAVGNLFISDGYMQVREVVKATGDIVLVAEPPDGPLGVAVDSAGDLFIAHGNRISELLQATGNLVNVAGTGYGGDSGDGGPATAATLYYPTGVAVDAAGDLFIAEGTRIREVVKATGDIITLAGGNWGFGGDGGPAVAALLAGSSGLALDENGDLFIAEVNNNRIREVSTGVAAIDVVSQTTTMNLTASGAATYGGVLALSATLSSDGAGVPNETVTFSVDGNGVGTATTNANGVATLAAASLAGVGTGSYAGGLVARFAGDPTYAATSAAANLTVNKAPLSVTANNQGKVYGASDPTLTYTVTGTFYNGDGPSAVSGVALSTATGAAATAGTHPITATGGTAANYAITDVSGTLTVSPAPLTITANNESRAYGAADPAFTASYSGLQYGQTLATSGVSGTPSLTSTDNASSSSGNYTITAALGTLSAQNYSFSFVNGTLTVMSPPTFALAGSSAGTFSAGQGVTIGWSAANVDTAGPSKITLGYDPDATAFDANQHWLEVDGVTAANGTGSYTWNTTGVASGTYHLSGYMYDFATGQAVYAHLATSIVITGGAPPAFTLTGPSAGTFSAGQSVTIHWTAANVDVAGPTKITLGYDPDTTPFDANEHWIEVDQVTAANGAGSYSWNTTGIAPGTYYLGGYTYDFSTGQQLLSHLGTSLVITASASGPPAFTLSGPSAGTFTAGQTVTIQWTAANVDVAGPSKISLGYDPDATALDANQHWIEVDGVTAANGAASYSWNTTGVASGTYYLSGYMYDFSTGHAVYSHLTTSIVITGGAPPAFTLAGPSAGTFTAGQSVTVAWTAANVDMAGPTKITLGYDSDATAFDANQHWLEVDGVTAANGAASYSWNTTGVASGTYYLSGYMYDFATGRAVYAHLGTSIVITGGAPPVFTLIGPSAGTFAPGTSVTIGWTAANVDVAGPTKITLGYDPDATPFDANQHWLEIDGVTAANGAGSYSWNTAGLAAGTYYLDGYMYDFATGKATYSHLGTSIVIN
jgi:hypothetical protein